MDLWLYEPGGTISATLDLSHYEPRATISVTMDLLHHPNESIQAAQYEQLISVILLILHKHFSLLASP